MWWPKQRTRVWIYRLLALPLFISVFLLGSHIWVFYVGVCLIMLASALESCHRCGGRLLMWGLPAKVADGTLVCSRCGGRWDLRGPSNFGH